MQKKVIVQVTGKQMYPEGHEDQQESKAAGTLYERNGVYYVVYKESECEGSGLGEVTTFLTFKEGSVVLNRKGAVDTKQEFKKGVLNRSIYITCYGKIWLSVLSHRVECDLTVQGGRISLDYDLFIEDNLVSNNVLLLDIKEDLP